MGSDRGSMDPLSALIFVKAWAQVVGVDATCLRATAPAGFCGDLGPAEVEYDPQAAALVVRGRLTPGVGPGGDASDLVAAKQELEALGGYRLEGGRLEVGATPAHPDEGERLLLRRDFGDPGIGPHGFVREVRALAEASRVLRQDRLEPLLREMQRRGPVAEEAERGAAPRSSEPIHDQVATMLDQIVHEMQRIGFWRDEPLPPEAYNFTAAFAMDTMPFPWWLQFVFVPRVREIIAARGAFPASSMVGTQAVREFDGLSEASDLVSLLSRFDALIESGGRS